MDINKSDMHKGQLIQKEAKVTEGQVIQMIASPK